MVDVVEMERREGGILGREGRGGRRGLGEGRMDLRLEKGSDENH